MKVLHVVPDFEPKWGGVYQAVSGLTRALTKKGVEVTLLATFREKIVPDEKFQKINQINLATGWKYQFSFKVKQTIEKLVKNYNAIHIHGLWQFPLSYSAFCARRFRIPYVYHIHGMLNEWPLKHHSLRKKIYALVWERANLNHASSIICLNPREEANVLKFGVHAPITIIPNGVHLTDFQTLSPKGRFLAKHPELSGKLLILFLGRIHPKKGIELLLAAFKKACENFHHIHLLLAGPEEDKHYANRLRQMVREYRLDKQITFLGPIFAEEKKELLIDSNLFILSSHDEAFSIAVLEAMASGLPVIITNECGFQGIESAGAGFLINYDVHQLARAMEHLIADEQKAKRMGEKGRELVLSHYHWDVIAEQLAQVYEKIVANTKRNL